MQKSRVPFAAVLGSLLIMAVFVCVFSSDVAAQINTTLKGSWSWEGRPDKTGSRAEVGFSFTQRGNRISGSYSVSSTGGPDDDDGGGAGSIPFIGTINGDTINIEYDPEDVHTDFETNFRYHKPKGKAPSTAIITFKNGKLELRQTSGDLADKSMKVPRLFTMHRNK
jgi:hypothetical protein